MGDWQNSSGFDDLIKVDQNGDPIQGLTNRGFYLSAEHVIWKIDNGDKLSAFIRYGQGEENISRVGEYFGIGTAYEGLLNAAIPYKLWLAVAISENGNPFLESQKVLGLEFDKSEINFEATAHFQVTEWLALQPDIQYIVNPGLLPNIENALVFGFRVELSQSF